MESKNKRDKMLKTTREEAKQKFDNFGKSFTLEEARLDTHILIDQIYDAHEAELKAKDERIEAQSSVIIACQNAILQKDERITELEAMIEKMKCCENCSFYPPQKCRFDTQYGCLDGLIPTNWKIKGTNNE